MPGWQFGFFLLLATGLSALAQLPATPVLEPADCQAFQQRAKSLPGAKQSGPGCAFFANVPALTMASGINIVDDSAASKLFVSRVYGLRKGDFEIHSAFDREIFFALFGLPAEGRKVYYGDRSKVELVHDAEGLVKNIFDDALNRGRFVSLRVTGDLGRAHNVLLVAREGDKYLCHDPTSGRQRMRSSEGLAVWILSESTASGKRTKKSYFSSYHLVEVGRPSVLDAAPRTLADLPPSLGLEPTAFQRKVISAAVAEKDEDFSSIESMEKVFPQIRFAAISKVVDGKARRVNAIGAKLEADDLRGVALIAKLSINSHKRRTRDLLPVLMLGKQPWVVTGYSSAEEGEESSITITDGTSSRRIPLDQLLKTLKASGSIFGHLRVPHD